MNSDIEKVITPNESISCLIASLGHDIGHPGLTNRYLIASKHTLALRYNDISILENMHSSTIFTLLADSQLNILINLNPDQ